MERRGPFFDSSIFLLFSRRMNEKGTRPSEPPAFRVTFARKLDKTR